MNLIYLKILFTSSFISRFVTPIYIFWPGFTLTFKTIFKSATVMLVTSWCGWHRDVGGLASMSLFECWCLNGQQHLKLVVNIFLLRHQSPTSFNWPESRIKIKSNLPWMSLFFWILLDHKLWNHYFYIV